MRMPTQQFAWSHPGSGARAAASEATARPAEFYPTALAWAFGLFNSLRIFTYLPTVLAIISSGSSGQHSLLTWLTWVGANSTMAAWLYERNGRRVDKTVLLNIGNAAMCLFTGAVIVWYRL